MTGALISEQELRERVVARAVDHGDVLRPDDLVLSYADVPSAPGHRLFRAAWGAGPSEDAIAGLLPAADEPDLMTDHAISALFRLWSADAPPAAEAVAAALTFLLDPVGRWAPVLTAADVAAWSGNGLTTPTVDTAAGRITRARFWWRRGHQAREVVVDVDVTGRVALGGGSTQVEER